MDHFNISLTPPESSAPAAISVALSEFDLRTASPASSSSSSENALPLDADAQSIAIFRLSVVAMIGAAIFINDASAADTVHSVKQRVFAANRKLHVQRQRLVYRPGPLGMEPLPDDETLGGAGVAQDGSAELDVLLAELTEAEMALLHERLLEAAKDGRSDDMLQLLDEGAEVECTDKDGFTALIKAAANGHADCVRRLIQAGADTNAQGHSGETAMIRAADEIALTVCVCC
jgi:hypothetical protein